MEKQTLVVDPYPNYEKFQQLVSGKNINPITLLATDYLNHFNEIHMLLEMIADLPNLIDDVLQWQVLSYQDHFKNSFFRDSKLAIEAYEYSPQEYKLPFEKCVAKMDQLTLETIKKTEIALNKNDTATLTKLIENYSPKMVKLIERCSAIINSKETTTQQGVIDDLFD